MPNDRFITLGTQDIPVPPIPLGRVRKLPVVCNRIYAAFAAGVLDDAVTDDIVQVLALGTGMEVAQLDALPASFTQLTTAIEVIVDVAGLRPVGGEDAAPPGEASKPAGIPTAGGMTSTPTLSPAQGGPGTTSTAE